MTINAIWKPFGLTIETADIASKKIAGITNYSIPDQIQVDRPNVDGSPYPYITVVQGREEMIQLTSSNVDDVLDIVGVGGQCLRGNSEYEGVKMWLAKWDQCSQRPVTGSVHKFAGIVFDGESLDIKIRGIISLDSLSCEHRGDATASIKLDLTKDPESVNNFAMDQGSNQPLPVMYDNRRRYTLGKTVIAGLTLIGKTGVEISSNVNVNRISTDSNPAAQFVHITENKPVITIRGIDPTWAVPAAGLVCTHANTQIYLRRRGETSGLDFEPDVATKHIKFTVKGRAFKTQLFGGSANNPAESVLMIYPEYDPVGVMVPIVALTGQAIT